MWRIHLEAQLKYTSGLRKKILSLEKDIKRKDKLLIAALETLLNNKYIVTMDKPYDYEMEIFDDLEEARDEAQRLIDTENVADGKDTCNVIIAEVLACVKIKISAQ